MNIRPLFVLGVLSAGHIFASGQKEDSSVSRTVNLQQAVVMALDHNHGVRISLLQVEESEHAKQIARSAYLPVLNNHSTFAHATDTQFIGIPAGALGTVGGNTIPSHTLVLNQGALNYALSDTNLTQPLTELFKIKATNDVARADLEASKGKASSANNQVALKVRQLYYEILIVQTQQQAIQAKIRATEDLQSERAEQVKYGSRLEADLIESRAQSLEARQDLLTAQLQLSNLHMQFNDAVGLPVESEVMLDHNVPAPSAASSREECIKLAFESNPEIAEAKAEVDKSAAGVREAKREYIPNVEAFAHYTYADNVPFLSQLRYLWCSFGLRHL